MTDEQRRLILTGIWFVGMLASASVAVSYMLVKNGAGVPLLGWLDVSDILKSIFAVYASYLGGMVAFWFVKPFKPRQGTLLEHIRFWIALVGAVTINAAYVARLLVGYWDAGAQYSDILNSKDIVLWMSFIVAPANLYFFGIRS
jgi:hypothetical protein